MQITQQILQLLLGKIASRRWHQVASVQDYLRHAIVMSRRAARQIRLAKDPVETRPVQCLRLISIVTACA